MKEAIGSQLVGAWRLISFESRDVSGEARYPLGKNAVGQITYTAEGRMSVILVRPDRPSFASGDMRRGTDTEVRPAFEGFLGYFGAYSVDPAAGTVTHHVEGASFPNWMGGDQVRFVELEGPRLILSTPPFLYDGRINRSVLVWERFG